MDLSFFDYNALASRWAWLRISLKGIYFFHFLHIHCYIC